MGGGDKTPLRHRWKHCAANRNTFTRPCKHLHQRKGVKLFDFWRQSIVRTPETIMAQQDLARSGAFVKARELHGVE